MKKLEIKKKYKARKGSKYNDKDAKIIGERLEQLMNKKGEKISTESIVSDAKNAKSPIHRYFEWNNSNAAKLYRLQQARNMTESIVDIVVLGNKTIEIRSFPNVCVKNKRYFVKQEAVFKHKDYRKQLIVRLTSILRNATEMMELLQTQI